MAYDDYEREGGSPVEVYHFVRGTDHWRWTSADSTVTVDYEEFVPEPITRGRIQINEEARTGSVDVTVPAENEVAQLFSGPRYYVPVELTIYRVQRDDPELEPVVLFSGEVRRSGAAVLLVTHSTRAAAVADRVLVLTRDGLLPSPERIAAD